MTAWKLYTPNTNTPWNLARVVHLHRRAGFGATWAEAQRDLADGPERAISRVLAGASCHDIASSSFETLSGTIGRAAVDASNIERLKAWWVYRCLFTPQPLSERLTLMWHNHFATSMVKVKNVQLMQLQNDTIRQHAAGKFHDLLHAMLHDPALLIWLDATDNRAGHPNENLARELMELFTLGIGHYQETDVREVARTLTGLKIVDGAVLQLSEQHDAGPKTLFGQTGPFRLDDLAERLMAQKATAERLAWRLCREFCSETVIDQTAIAELATCLRDNQLRIQAGLETIFRSERFFSKVNLRHRVSDPVSFLLTPMRTLEFFRNPPNSLAVANALRRMGQDLFTPPNVGGWTGGRSWLSTQTVIARTNAIAELINGRFHLPRQPWDPLPLLTQYGISAELTDVIRFLGQLLFGDIDDDLLQAVLQDASQESDWAAQVRRSAVQLLTRSQSHLH